MTGCFFPLSMPAAVFAAIRPFPPFPAILLAPATADAPGDETKTPTIFKKTTQRKAPVISRETAGKNKGARIPVEVGFGAHDSGKCGGGFERDEPRDCKRRRVLAGVGVFSFRFFSLGKGLLTRGSNLGVRVCF